MLLDNIDHFRELKNRIAITETVMMTGTALTCSQISSEVGVSVLASSALQGEIIWREGGAMGGGGGGGGGGRGLVATALVCLRV